MRTTLLLLLLLPTLYSTCSANPAPTRQAAFWFKPARATHAADIAMIRAKSNLISTLFVYCEFTVLPDGSFGIASDQRWFRANWGDHTMCTPQYFSELAGDGPKAVKVQLMLSMGDAMVTSYRRAFDDPQPLLAGMLRAIQPFDAEIVTGWNVDWEPCHPNSAAPATVPADGVAFARLLAQMKSAHALANRTISVDASQWCNMTSNFAALAAAADSVQDMGTYHADSAENFQSKLNLTAAVPREKLWVGLGFGEQMIKFPYETTQAGLSERFEALAAAGVQNVAMFELPSAEKLEQWNMTQAWWQELEKWVGKPRAETVSHAAAAAVDGGTASLDASTAPAINQAVMMSPTFTTDPRVFANISANVVAHCPASFTTLSMKAWAGSYAPNEANPLPPPNSTVVAFLQSVKAKSKGRLQVWGGVEVCPGRAYDCMLNYSRSALTGTQIGQAAMAAGLDGITLYASPYCNNKNCKRQTAKYARGIAEIVLAARNVTKAYRKPDGIAVSWWQNEWDNPQIVAAAGAPH